MNYYLKQKIVAQINSILNRFNHHLVHVTNSKVSKDKLLINIGSGDWSYNGWINLDYVTEWYKKSLAKHKIVPYDIRSDKLPFQDNSIDAIYCSHVIEHIENDYVQIMFDECYRAMKKDGVFRIACPDAEYLYQITKKETEFWQWRKKWFQSSLYDKVRVPQQVDYLVREIATPKLLGYVNGLSKEEYKENYNIMEMNEFLEYLISNLNFRNDYPGDHINYFTFSKIERMLKLAGFSLVIRSKYLSSASTEFAKAHKFDLTCPVMSLYVEAIK